MRNITVALVLLALSPSTLFAVTTARPKYGCFMVTANALNIRKRPYSFSNVVRSVAKGDILIKRKRWCTPRGFWCAVTTQDGVKGYADKSYMKVAPCPARLSK